MLRELVTTVLDFAGLVLLVVAAWAVRPTLGLAAAGLAALVLSWFLSAPLRQSKRTDDGLGG